MLLPRRMEIWVAAFAGLPVVRLSGDLRLWGKQGIADKIRDRVRSVLAEGHKRVIVNLSEVTHMDSRGIGCLARCYATATDQGAELFLVIPPGLILDTLNKLKFSQIWGIHPDEKTAAESFAKSAGAA